MEVSNRPFATKAIPGALRMALRFKHTSYRQLSLKTGVSKSTIGNLASGHALICNPETASAIARGLGMPTEDLFVLEPFGNYRTPNRRAA